MNRTWKLITVLSALVIGLSSCTSSSSGSTPTPAASQPSGAPVGKPSEAPKKGGELIYGISGEPQGFNTTSQACTQPCQLVAMSIYDPLFTLDDKLSPVPYLASGITPNGDFTEWKVTLRSGVKFHDGSAFNADVVRQNFKAAMTPPALAADALNGQIASIDVVDDLNVSFKMKKSQPSFPLVLTGSTGFMVAPATIAAGVTGGLKPIGTGPFVFKEWQQGDHITVERNASYWQKDLPYLDKVTFRPIEDAAARTAAFQRGELDAIMTDVPDQIAKLANIPGTWLNKSTQAASTDEWVFNNEAGPTKDIRVRQALIYSLDRKAYAEVLGAGVVVPANGPFPPGTLGYLENPGGASYDLERAKQLVAAYKAEKGSLSITIQAGQDKATAAQLAQSMWQKAGIDVKIEIKEGNVALMNLLQGNYEVIAGALPGNVNPGEHAIWWSSAAVQPIGQISTNYARIKDPQIDQALATLATAQDPAARRAAAEAINKRFAEQSYAAWTYWTVWGTATKSTIHGFVAIELPGGQTSDNTNQGLHFLTRAWKG